MKHYFTFIGCCIKLLVRTEAEETTYEGIVGDVQSACGSCVYTFFFFFFFINSHTFFNFILCVQVQDGFIAHFYAVCEHISPVLAWGFLGPKNSLHDFCCFFKVKCNLMTSVS